MSEPASKFLSKEISSPKAIEKSFPILPLSQLAEQESWRKEINRPIYHIHKWWATRLGSVFRTIVLGALGEFDGDYWNLFYKHHAFRGKIVLDPFMGSGTTLGEALKLGAKVVGCDINPVSTFLVKQALTRVDEGDLRKAFHRLEEGVAEDIRHYYETLDRESSDRIPVLYYFWVKIVTTPDGEVVPLFSRYVFAQNAYPKKKPDAQIVCRSCFSVLRGRYDTTSITCSRCGTNFDPQEGPVSGQFVTTAKGNRYRVKDLLPADGKPFRHQLYALLALRKTGEKVYLSPNAEDFQLYEKAKERLASEELPLPRMTVRPGHNTNQARGYNYLNWEDFFNPRQLLCLGLLLKAILQLEDSEIKEQMLCLFSSTLEFNNLFCSFKGEGTGAVRHMFSHHILKPERMPLENSVWGTEKSSGTFSTLFESRLIPAKRYLDKPFEISLSTDMFGTKGPATKVVSSPPIYPSAVKSWKELTSTEFGALILNGDSAKLPLPDSVVDAVVTDPPYFDFVHYSELSDFFFAWLSPALKEKYPWFAGVDSSNVGEVQHKDPHQFSHLLARVFSECHRVLKVDGVLAFSFHHSRAEAWAAIHESIIAAGLQVVATHPIHAEQKGASPKLAAKNPISLDAILVCRKSNSVSIEQADDKTVLQKAINHIQKMASSGMQISSSDRFVILASQALVGDKNSSFDAIERRISKLRDQMEGLLSE